LISSIRWYLEGAKPFSLLHELLNLGNLFLQSANIRACGKPFPGL
jgi:hypothetical protein